MIGREDLDDCPKCRNTGIELHRQSLTGDSVAYMAKWCDCSLAVRYIAGYIAGFRSQAYPKARIALLQRDFLERMTHLAVEQQQTPETLD